MKGVVVRRSGRVALGPMNNPFGKDAPLYEQVKIVAEALIPVLNAFRDELGAERADAIAARGIAEWRRRLAQFAADRVVGDPREKWEKTAADTLGTVGDSVDIEDLEQTPEMLRFNVTGCQFAELFHDLGEPELGHALLCAYDFTQLEELTGDAVQLTRHGTLMDGASCCDFQYRFKSSDDDDDQ